MRQLNGTFDVLEPIGSIALGARICNRDQDYACVRVRACACVRVHGTWALIASIYLKG